MLAGRIMMESGSEAYRVEDTMNRIARNTLDADIESYVTATGIFMSINDQSVTQITQARERSINLEKIDAANKLSRQYAEGQLSLDKLYGQLKSVDKQTREFNRNYRTISAGIASLSLMFLLGGNYNDILLAFFIGSIGYYISSNLYAKFKMKFINDLLAVLAISLLAVLSNRLGIVTNLDSLIIGCVMPLVPGLAITTAMRDMFEGHVVTGIVRSVEALLVAIVIGFGIALVLQWFS